MTAHPLIQVATAAAALLLTSTAQAQLFRTYLAASGNDANPCTLVAPCRLLPAALAAVASGGEIWMLDSANYNTSTVTVGKSVSILAVPGVVGSIVAQNGGSAVSIAASGLVVGLKNVVIGPVAGAAPGMHGVHLTGASTLIIEESLIANVPEFGVRVDGSGGVLKVSRSTLRNNAKYAILLTGGSATVSDTQMLANGWGGFSAQVSSGTSASSISDSVISGGANGINMRSDATGATARVTVTRSTIERTDYALISYILGAGGSASIAISNSMIVNNFYGWYQEGAGAAVRSFGNNHFSDNSQNYGSLSPVPLQ